ncbi:MAG: hypothetical protein RIR00_363 [Pseudomonadota bacterium]
MQALLSFDQAPPFPAPLRFFLSAPLYGIAAGALLLTQGEAVLASRWLPGALALTHLLTLGFLLQVMLGALIQILPVVAGANLRQPLWLARLVHLGFNAGSLCLIYAFLRGDPAAYLPAGVLLGSALLLFLLATGLALKGVPDTSPSIRGLKLGLVALPMVAGLGLLILLVLSGAPALPLVPLVDLHAAWGLAAWAGGILAAVGYVVVPMFQLTPPYPPGFAWQFNRVLLGLLVLATLAFFFGIPGLPRLAEAGIALAGAGFIHLTLDLQRRSKRPVPDVSRRFWRSGLAAALVACAMAFGAALLPPLATLSRWAPLFGVVLGVGGFMAILSGMLYKIVPFLVWLHLQNLGRPAPNMNRILGEPAQRRHYQAHLFSLALLVPAALFPESLTRPAGLALMLSQGLLLLNLLQACKVYRQHGRPATPQTVAG